jgi:hypothetical protein
MPARTFATADLALGAHQRGLACDLVAHHGAAAELEDAGLHAVQVHLQHELVAGFHRALEARAVDAHEVVDVVVLQPEVQ